MEKKFSIFKLKDKIPEIIGCKQYEMVQITNLWCEGCGQFMVLRTVRTPLNTPMALCRNNLHFVIFNVRHSLNEKGTSF